MGLENLGRDEYDNSIGKCLAAKRAKDRIKPSGVKVAEAAWECVTSEPVDRDLVGVVLSLIGDS